MTQEFSSRHGDYTGGGITGFSAGLHSEVNDDWKGSEADSGFGKKDSHIYSLNEMVDFCITKVQRNGHRLDYRRAVLG